MSWTPEREKKLKELWGKGHTASQIASMLGDTTRNAVIGKAHRLNLQGRATSKKTIPKVSIESILYQKSKTKNLVERKDLKLFY